VAGKRIISIDSIDAIDFSKYGQIIRIPASNERKPDFESDVINFYASLGVLDSGMPLEFGICTFKKRELIIEQLEQHIMTQELLFAVDDDFIMPVTSNLQSNGKNIPDLENLLAVRILRGEGVIFHRGTWHWVPYSYKEVSFALVGFTKDTAKNDLTIHTLATKIPMKEIQ
jgi:ureidoglycolate hydrolase